MRSGTGQVIQYFRLRSGYDKPAGGENTRVNLCSPGVNAVQFGTVMVKRFLVEIDPENLMCKEISDFHGDISGDLQCMSGAATKTLKRFDNMVVYSTGRYIIRDEGKISKEDLSRNYFNASIR